MASERLDKLKARREALEARIRREQAKERAKERKADTRRKILAGAAVLDRAEKDEAAKAELHRLLAGFLVRDDDRALFGLAPLPHQMDAMTADQSSELDNRAAA